MKKFPVLETKRLILREFNNEDAKNLFANYSIEIVTRYYDQDEMKDIKETLELLREFKSRYYEKRGIRWAITLKDNNQYIGDCGFNGWDFRNFRTWVGYALIPEFWGKGYASESVHEILNYGFNETNIIDLHRVSASVQPENKRAKSLLHRLGFTYEGTLRESMYNKTDGFLDAMVYSILKREYNYKKEKSSIETNQKA